MRHNFYTRPRNPVQPAESAFVSIRTLRSCSYAHLWNISCCSEVQCRIGTSQKAWRSARRFPLAASVKSNISACAYRGQECRLCTTSSGRACAHVSVSRAKRSGRGSAVQRPVTSENPVTLLSVATQQVLQPRFLSKVTER